MAGVLSPKDLNKMAADAELAAFDEERQARKRKADQDAELREAFSSRELHPEVIDRINRAVTIAAKVGKNQLQVLTFPSSFCNDGGRRINSFDRTGRTRSRALARRPTNSTKKSCGRSVSRSVRRSSTSRAECRATSVCS